MPDVLTVSNVRKAYGSVEVLRGVSFSLRRGSMTTLTGRSGSGKSTLFKLIAGLDHPTSGQILIEGVDNASMDDEAASDLRLRRLGLVFQSLNLLPDLSAAQNVRLPLDLAGVPRREADARVAELLTLVGLEHAASARPARLSGGEAQRAAIARALANRPALVLADEPTSALDRDNAENVLRLFDDLNRSLGATILIISHDPLAVSRARARLHIDDGVVGPPLVEVPR